MFLIESCAKQQIQIDDVLRKGRLRGFRSNRTAVSDGEALKVGNYVWHDSESMATKVCSQLGRK